MWPQLLAGAVAAYGESIVWEIGLKALSYPPTWAHQVHEVNRVQLALKTHFELNPELLSQLRRD